MKYRKIFISKIYELNLEIYSSIKNGKVSLFDMGLRLYIFATFLFD